MELHQMLFGKSENFEDNLDRLIEIFGVKEEVEKEMEKNTKWGQIVKSENLDQEIDLEGYFGESEEKEEIIGWVLKSPSYLPLIEKILKNTKWEEWFKDSFISNIEKYGYNFSNPTPRTSGISEVLNKIGVLYSHFHPVYKKEGKEFKNLDELLDEFSFELSNNKCGKSFKNLKLKFTRYNSLKKC